MIICIKITPFTKQLWCASAVIIGNFAQGMVFGFASSLLPALEDPESPIKLDIDSASWLVSSVGPAGLIGIVYSCTLMDWYGRRFAFLLSLVPGTVGWILMYLAQNYVILLVGRILTGISTLAEHTVGLIILGEYISPKHRGVFLNSKTTGVYLGSTTVHLLGKYMHWKSIILVTMIPNIVAFLIAYTCPESPAWLATRNKFDKCKCEFIWLRGNDDRSLNELNELINCQKIRLALMPTGMTLLEKTKEFLWKFTRKDFLKPVSVVFCTLILMESSGKHYFQSYALQIVNDVTDTGTYSYYYVLGIDVIIIIGSLISTVLIRLMMRRTLLFSSGVVSLIVLAFMCSYYYMVSINLVKNYPWIIILLLFIYFFISSLGCAPVPLTIQGELFPVAHRESASTVSGIFVSLLMMGILKLFPYLLDTVRVYGTFAIFGTITAISLLTLYFILPETKDKTLQEIENKFSRKI